MQHDYNKGRIEATIDVSKGESNIKQKGTTSVLFALWIEISKATLTTLIENVNEQAMKILGINNSEKIEEFTKNAMIDAIKSIEKIEKENIQTQKIIDIEKEKSKNKILEDLFENLGE